MSNLLIICFDNIGDLIFSSGLLPPLRKAFPNARVGIWCKEYTAAIAGLIANVDVVHASDPFWDRSPGRAQGSLTGFLRTGRAVRRQHYDCAIIPSLRWQAAAAAIGAGIPLRIGVSGRRNQRLLTHCLPARDRTRPVMYEMAKLLEPLGVGAGNLAYALSRERLPSFGQADSERKRIVLHPFAGSSARCVPRAVWLAFAELLRQAGWQVVWTGTKAELEDLSLEPAVARNDSLPSSDDLVIAAARIGAADVFVGHDSGPLHIASALGVPTVGVFAPGEPLRTFPQGQAPFVLVTANSPLAIGPQDLVNALERLNVEAPDTTLHI